MKKYSLIPLTIIFLLHFSSLGRADALPDSRNTPPITFRADIVEWVHDCDKCPLEDKMPRFGPGIRISGSLFHQLGTSLTLSDSERTAQNAVCEINLMRNAVRITIHGLDGICETHLWGENNAQKYIRSYSHSCPILPQRPEDDERAYMYITESTGKDEHESPFSFFLAPDVVTVLRMVTMHMNSSMQSHCYYPDKGGCSLEDYHFFVHSTRRQMKVITLPAHRIIGNPSFSYEYLFTRNPIILVHKIGANR